MVIQKNMSPKAIVGIWEQTGKVFEKFRVPLNEEKLEDLLSPEHLASILFELNHLVGSSKGTCIEGG
ncbi:hypothetical protein GCM10008967_11560 [Bacillus carboniphilus]|uniref:Uncharacterized protein n=1 Tax=Bacillus carboniphilus TaxID=86663 RepID=A0ABN0W1K2_9BACI